MSSYIYQKTQTKLNDANLEKLNTEIEDSNINTLILNTFKNEEEIIIIFEQDLTPQEKTELDSIINSHSSLNDKEKAILIVKNAVDFGQELIIEFAGENVALGITQAGKTKQVADYLSDVTRYVQTGSLYEVISEIDRLISNGLSTDLEPYITLDRLNTFKQKIVDYLS